MGDRRFTSTIPGLLDSKCRVCIPSPFRQVLDAQCTKGIYLFLPVLDPVIECFGQEFYDETQSKFTSVNPLFDDGGSDEVYDFKYFNAHTTPVPMDINGRVRLPDELIAYAGLQEKVVFVGCGKTFQICTPEQAKKLDDENKAVIRARMLAQRAARQAQIAALMSASTAAVADGGAS